MCLNYVENINDIPLIVCVEPCEIEFRCDDLTHEIAYFKEILFDKLQIRWNKLTALIFLNLMKRKGMLGMLVFEYFIPKIRIVYF